MQPTTEDPKRLDERNDPSIAIALMLAQYKMSKSEEIVTKNVFRVMWFAFSAYLSSTTMDIDNIAITTEATLFLVLQSFSLLLVGGVLYITSRGAKNYIWRQSNNLIDLLVSSDYKRKDLYVREFHRNEIREAHFSSRTLLGREDLMWLTAVTFILYLRVASAVFAQ